MNYDRDHIAALAGFSPSEWEATLEAGRKEAMVKLVGSLAVERGKKCHDDRCRDAIYRMYEQFAYNDCNNPNMDFERLEKTFSETMEAIDRIYEHDQEQKSLKPCESCGKKTDWFTISAGDESLAFCEEHHKETNKV